MKLRKCEPINIDFFFYEPSLTYFIKEKSNNLVDSSIIRLWSGLNLFNVLLVWFALSCSEALQVCSLLLSLSQEVRGTSITTFSGRCFVSRHVSGEGYQSYPFQSACCSVEDFTARTVQRPTAFDRILIWIVENPDLWLNNWVSVYRNAKCRRGSVLCCLRPTFHQPELTQEI